MEYQSPEFEFLFKPLLAWDTFTEDIYHFEVVMKDVDYYLGIIDNEKDREFLRPHIEKAIGHDDTLDKGIGHDVISVALNQFFKVFPDTNIPIPVLAEFIKDCRVASLAIGFRKKELPSFPGVIESKKKITAVEKKLSFFIRECESLLKAIETLHPDGWPMMVYLNPITRQPVMEENDFKEWDEYIRKTKEYTKETTGLLRKLKRHKCQISEYPTQGRSDKADIPDKRNALMKASDLFFYITGKYKSISRDTYKDLYKDAKAPNEIYSGSFIDLVEILFPEVITKAEINTYCDKHSINI